MAQRPRSSGRAPVLAVLGALMIVGGAFVILSFALFVLFYS